MRRTPRCNSRFCVLLLILLFTCSCKKQSSLEEYASEVRSASRPGVEIHQFVNSTLGLPPDERLAHCYQFINSYWKYLPELPGNDHFACAENLVGEHRLQGDCDDYSALLLSVCRDLGLTAHVCLGSPYQVSKEGHAWVEVAICSESGMDSILYKRLRNVFGDSARLILRSEYYWLQLSPIGSLDHYNLTHTIDSSGILTAVSSE